MVAWIGRHLKEARTDNGRNFVIATYGDINPNVINNSSSIQTEMSVKAVMGITVILLGYKNLFIKFHVNKPIEYQ